MSEHGEDRLPRQLTNDAVLTAVSGRLNAVDSELRDIRREQRQDHEAVRKDIAELREVIALSIEEGRETAKVASEARLLGKSNVADIEALRKKQQADDYALAVLPEGGGLRSLIKRVLELGRTHEDAALVDGARKGVWSAQAKWFIAGAGVAGSVATAVAVLIDRV